MHHTSRPRPAGLTVTTTVSMERLHFLEGLCASWTGPLIAAAYLPLIGDRVSPKDDDLRAIAETFNGCGRVPEAWLESPLKPLLNISASNLDCHASCAQKSVRWSTCRRTNGVNLMRVWTSYL